jgi:hypothetical protein
VNKLIKLHLFIYSFTGEIMPVDGTIYDLRTRQDLFQLLQQFPPGPNGFDNNYCLFNDNQLVLAARFINIFFLNAISNVYFLELRK